MCTILAIYHTHVTILKWTYGHSRSRNTEHIEWTLHFLFFPLKSVCNNISTIQSCMRLWMWTHVPLISMQLKARSYNTLTYVTRALFWYLAWKFNGQTLCIFSTNTFSHILSPICYAYTILKMVLMNFQYYFHSIQHYTSHII